MITTLKQAGVIIIDERDTGSHYVWTISIARGQEASAVNALLDALDALAQVSLADHRRKDFESMTSYQKQGEAIVASTGGHGWSAEPRVLARKAAFTEMMRLAAFNHGEHSSNRGRVQLSK